MLQQSFLIALLSFTYMLFTSPANLHPYNRKLYYIVHLRAGRLAVA